MISLFRNSSFRWLRNGELRSGPSLLKILLLICVVEACGINSCSMVNLENDIGDNEHANFEKLLNNHPELDSVANIVYDSVSSHSDDNLYSQQLALFAEVFVLAQKKYINMLSPERLIAGALSGVKKIQANRMHGESKSPEIVMLTIIEHMISNLDAHSAYLPPDVYEQAKARRRGRFGGVGVQVKVENGLIRCIAAIEGTPAQRAGIEAGDRISHIDGEPVSGMNLRQAVERMRGPPGSTVLIRVLRGRDSQSFSFRIVREVIHVESVRARLEGDIGYVQIHTFSEQTYRSMYDAINEFSSRQGHFLKGLVIDLRDNPGGLLDQALKVSDAFLAEGEIVSTIGRDNNQVRRFRANPQDIAFGIPIAILINGGSASASEIVSGALKDHGRAIVLGERSFGKGSVQTVMPLGNGQGALRLTTALYFTPSGKSIQVHGIEPDIVSENERSVSRENNLDNYLSAQGPLPRSSGELLQHACPHAASVDDPILTCAFSTLRRRNVFHELDSYR